MARILFFRMLFRKLSEIFQYNIFFNYEYFFFQSAFWSLFNLSQRSQSNQEQCSMCCSSPCFLFCCALAAGRCNTFQHNLKEIGVLQPVFPDYFYFLWLWFNCLQLLQENIFHEKIVLFRILLCDSQVVFVDFSKHFTSLWLHMDKQK